MNNINVLVTGIGGPIAQGLMAGLRKRKDITIIGVDRREITGGHQFCDHTYQIAGYSKLKDYREAILDIVEKDNIKIIFPSLHEEVELYHDFKNQWNAIVALPESDLFDVLLNKEKTYQFLKENDMDEFVPKYHGLTAVMIEGAALFISNGTLISLYFILAYVMKIEALDDITKAAVRRLSRK